MEQHVQQPPDHRQESGPGPFAGSAGAPPHTRTESTLAPTAEFTRIFLLAWIIRYIFRGFSGATFAQRIEQGGVRGSILNALSVPGRAMQKWLGGPNKPGNRLDDLEAAAYSLSIGVGSSVLSWRYSRMVKNDIENLFREAVAEEKGIPQEKVTFADISQSDNAIIRRTVSNYHSKTLQRLGTDALFFLAAPLRYAPITDMLLGLKGVQTFSDTWKRKTTLFEDLVGFVNNKINPRNGLGQPVSIGEVFDLYQHYADMFHPDKMFTNVLGRDGVDMERWNRSQPIFQRITELMNQTYAYKHTGRGDASAQAGGAHFALPKLIHLLGHDYLDPDRPERSLTAIELANSHGIAALKQMDAQLAAGQTLAQVRAQFGVTLPVASQPAPASETNAVLPKGSTMQPEHAPVAKIDAATIAHIAPGARTAALQA